MKIKITQSMLDTGVKCSIYKCPVALALRTRYFDINVGSNNAYIRGTRHTLSEKLQNYIQKYDVGVPMVPCTLVISNGAIDYEN
jgi:hypothetical protein